MVPRLAIVIVSLICIGVTPSLARSQDAPRKIALIVGVSKYKKDGLENLKYAHKDASDLAAALVGSGDGF